MSLLVILLIIALGLLFIFIELFLIPGTAFVGLLGLIVSGAGVYLTYDYHGATYGHIVMLVTSVAAVIMLVIGLKRISSLRWADPDAIDSKVNVLEEVPVNEGDTGVAFNVLRPNGMATFGDKRLEVYSIGEYIDKDTPVVVTKVTHDRIYVKQKA